MGTAVNIEVCPSNMKSFAFLAIVLVSASAIHIPEKYAHYKPGYMRIPEWEKIMSGEKKLNQKEPTMTFEPRNDYLPRADCGIPNAKSNNKIVGGQEATPHQFPWQVGLFFDGYFCGGSIISEKYILTAAHCADGVFKHTVVVGAHDIRASDNLEITAYSPTVHPEWSPSTLSNDLAILELSENIDFESLNGNARPNCLAQSGDYSGQKALVSGWGRESDTSSGIARYLNYVDNLPVMSQAECEDYWGNLNEGVVCIDTTGGHGSCNGDSGGPMSIPGPTYNQIGIVSFGSAAGCEIGAPAGFTEVSKYIDWISSVTGMKL